MIYIHCDRDDCTEKYPAGSPQLLTWHRCETLDVEDDQVVHFCSRDHLVQQLVTFDVPDNAEGVA